MSTANTNSGSSGHTSSLAWARLKSKLTNKSWLYLTLFLLILPTFGSMALFNYFPKLEAIKYAFYRWDGSTIEEFRGLSNFISAFSKDEPMFWQSFKLVGILLAANAVKMWPSILVAIAIHRLKSDRWKYVYRVLFVIPMVIPAMVWLLIWKSFYDPTVGIFNTILNATGLMRVLLWLDTAMPQLAAALSPIRAAAIDNTIGSVWGLGVLGVMLLSLTGGLRGVLKGWLWWIMLLGVSYVLLGPIRMFIALAVFVPVAYILSRSISGRDTIKWAGIALMILAAVLVLTTMVWTEPTNGEGSRSVFASGMPAWLGHTKLIVPAIIFWGFPWVGVVGVLIYLAGLQNISADVYEAAELDGVGTFGKLFKIELPLIMTQVRINLIFMTIGTLNTYGLILLLLGPHGGPGNKGMVPGLYMYREAFINTRFGYACALGMVMFVIVLSITILYQKYVKVEK